MGGVLQSVWCVFASVAKSRTDCPHEIAPVLKTVTECGPSFTIRFMEDASFKCATRKCSAITLS